MANVDDAFLEALIAGFEPNLLDVFANNRPLDLQGPGAGAQANVDASLAAKQLELHRLAGRDDFLPLLRGLFLFVYMAIAHGRFSAFDHHIQRPELLLASGFHRTLQLTIGSFAYVSGTLLVHIRETLPHGVRADHPNLSQLWVSTNRERRDDRRHLLEVRMQNGVAEALIYIHAEYKGDPEHWNVRHRFALSITLMSDEGEVLAESKVDTFVYARPRKWAKISIPMQEPPVLP